MRWFSLTARIFSSDLFCCIQVNALKAICPATLDVLLKILSSPPTGGGMGAGGDDVRQNKTLLHDLVLKCMVRTVHVVHCCSPDQVQCVHVCVCVCVCVQRPKREIFSLFDILTLFSVVLP